MSEQAAAQNLALALAEKWDGAFEKAYWGETNSFVEVVQPVAEVMVRLAEAIVDVACRGSDARGWCWCGAFESVEPFEDDSAHDDWCREARASLAAFDALVKEGE